LNKRSHSLEWLSVRSRQEAFHIPVKTAATEFSISRVILNMGQLMSAAVIHRHGAEGKGRKMKKQNKKSQISMILLQISNTCIACTYASEDILTALLSGRH
jgi:hypothetical protein